ncbi:MAG: hypothetical protein OEZ58_02605 [Gammaproteobacteria bacterium]|nr:hypothetical protein [Gammaproteobacteria bacterium]MDH5727853.1 hypothetical protein [Gammaproteobacteria bacterium]
MLKFLNNSKQSLLFILFISFAHNNAASAFEAQLQGIYTPPDGGMVGFIAEYRVDRLPVKMSLVNRAASIAYNHRPSGYVERGFGELISMGARLYSESNRLAAYLALELAFLDVGVEWYTPTSEGTSATKGLAPILSFGYKLGDKELSIEPNVLAFFLSAAGNKQAQVKALFGFGFTLGVRF